MSQYVTPRSFPARFDGKCQVCPKSITKGQSMVIFGQTVTDAGRTVNACYHAGCLTRFLTKLGQTDRLTPSGRRSRLTRRGWKQV